MRHLESKLQISCISWFRLQYSQYLHWLYAVPNGGKRSITEAKIMKAEGVLAGVADLHFVLPNEKYHTLYIELKTAKGKQTEAQEDFERHVKSVGHAYEIVRSLEEFMNVINKYLKNEL